MREKCVEDVGCAGSRPQGEVYSFLTSLCHLFCFLLSALMLWMTSSCSLCCTHLAESRLASEFTPNLSLFLGIADQACLSLSSWLHSYLLLPNSWPFVLSLCFYPALFCLPAPFRDPLLPSFPSSLDYVLSCLDQRCKP